MIIQIDTSLMNPHTFIDCEIKYRRELKIIYMFGRNHCYLNDLIAFMLDHYQQSESTTRRKIKEIDSRNIGRITRVDKTYVSLMSIGLTYVTKTRVGTPRALQNDIQLEKAHVLLTHCKPTYRLPKKGQARINYLSEKHGISIDAANNLIKQIEIRHVYLLKLDYQSGLLILNALQYDPYEDAFGCYNKLNSVINIIYTALDLKQIPKIRLNLQLVTKYRVLEKTMLKDELQDRFSKSFQTLKKLCNKRDSMSVYMIDQIEWDHSSIVVEQYK